MRGRRLIALKRIREQAPSPHACRGGLGRVLLLFLTDILVRLPSLTAAAGVCSPCDYIMSRGYQIAHSHHNILIVS